MESTGHNIVHLVQKCYGLQDKEPALNIPIQYSLSKSN